MCLFLWFDIWHQAVLCKKDILYEHVHVSIVLRVGWERRGWIDPLPPLRLHVYVIRYWLTFKPNSQPNRLYWSHKPMVEDYKTQVLDLHILTYTCLLVILLFSLLSLSLSLCFPLPPSCGSCSWSCPEFESSPWPWWVCSPSSQCDCPLQTAVQLRPGCKWCSRRKKKAREKSNMPFW